MDLGTFCAERETFGISINKDVLTKIDTKNCSAGTAKNSEAVLSFSVRFAIGLSWLIVVFVGTIGNILVLFVISRVKTMWTIPNWLLFNLAIADALMTVIALPILGIFQTFSYPVWKLPNWSCYLLNCFTHIGALSSGASLAAISVHRFIMIRLSRKIHITKKHLIVTIIFIWLIAIGGSVSSMTSAGVIGLIRPISGSMRLTRLCIQVNPSESREDFQLAFRLSMYIIYALFLFLLYSNIGFFIYKSKTPGHEITADRSEARKRQAVKMLATATAVMITSYFPYMVLVCLTLFAKPGYFSKVFAIEILCNILTGVNHVVNPFIYCAFSSQFRQAFKNCFARLRDGKRKKSVKSKTGLQLPSKKPSSPKLMKEKQQGTCDDMKLDWKKESEGLPTASSQITLSSLLDDSLSTVSGEQLYSPYLITKL